MASREYKVQFSNLYTESFMLSTISYISYFVAFVLATLVV